MSFSSWSASQTSPEHLVSWANHQITVLEESLEHIAHTKSQLRDHAQEVKSQIHTAISRQLETLRNREVWLLGQVEVIKHAKDDMLCQQQGEISRAIGSVNKALQCLENTMNTEDSNVEQVLTQTLERLKTLSLHPCEPPHITFKANGPAMKNAIFKFGKVDSKGLPTEVAFADPSRPSSSLPRCFEEYEDAEHHVLYKTLESIKRERNQDHSIQVKIPRIRDSDWLYRPSASYPSQSQPSESKPTNTGTPLAAWLLKSSAAALPRLNNDASICQWLRHIQEGEMEDDFEFLEHSKTRSTSESESIEIVPMSVEATDNRPSFQLFDSIKRAPSTAWLLQSQANVHVNEKDSDSVKSLASQLNYFREVSDRTEDWLPRTTEDKNGVSRPTDFCYTQCACLPDKIEIEDLEEIVCNPSATSSPHLDTRRWLKRERKPDDGLESPSLAKVCRANESCSSLDECCCRPNCKERSQGSHNTWLLMKNVSPSTIGHIGETSPCCSQFTENVLGTMRKISNAPNSEWLAQKTSESKEDIEKCEVDPLVKYMKSMSLSSYQGWVRQDAKLSESGISGSCDGSGSTTESALDDWLVQNLSSSNVAIGEEKESDSKWLKSQDSDNKTTENKFKSVFDEFEKMEWVKKDQENTGDNKSVMKSNLSDWIISNNL